MYDFEFFVGALAMVLGGTWTSLTLGAASEWILSREKRRKSFAGMRGLAAGECDLGRVIELVMGN